MIIIMIIIIRSFWIELGQDTFTIATATICRQLKETLFARLLSLFDEISKGIIIDEIKEDIQSMLIKINNGTLIIEQAVKKANLHDDGRLVNNDRLLDLLKICYDLCYQNDQNA